MANVVDIDDYRPEMEELYVCKCKGDEGFDMLTDGNIRCRSCGATMLVQKLYPELETLILLGD